MRKELLDAIGKTIIFEYDVPNVGKGLSRTIFSTDDDKCYSSADNNKLAEIIYNSVIEYSFGEFELSQIEYEALHTIALKTKLKYDDTASEEQKLKYGFYGEVLLYCMLFTLFQAKPIISRGYFYNPLENSETKGYDSYHLIQNGDNLELWFGEVKFHGSHTSGINSALANIEKAISDDYLERNLLALRTRVGDFNVAGSKIEGIIKEWDKNPSLKIVDFVKKNNAKLVYPVVLLYNQSEDGYDDSVLKAINYIKDNYSAIKFNISINYSIFFIFVPMADVKAIKLSVMKWIEVKKALMS